MERPDARGTRFRRGFSKVEALVVAGIIGVLPAILLPAIEAARPYRPPTIPDREPDEEYRVYLPGGFSIVRPPFREVKTYRADPTHQYLGGFEFRSPIQNRPGAYASASWSKRDFQPEQGAVEIKFQGRQAWMKTQGRASVFMDDPGRFDADIACKNGDIIIFISYSYFDEQPAIPPMI